MAAQVLTPSPFQVSAATASPSTPTPSALPDQQTPEGLVKAILPCTPLAIVKTLEHCQVYNPLRPYGSRAFGRTITVVNRSEVVGRPLAALLANDGARVFSVDLDGVQEFTRKKVVEGEEGPKSSFHPYHVIKKCDLSLEQCLATSDVVIGGVSPGRSISLRSWTWTDLARMVAHRFRASRTRFRLRSSRRASSRSTFPSRRTLRTTSRRRRQSTARASARPPSSCCSATCSGCASTRPASGKGSRRVRSSSSGP